MNLDTAAFYFRLDDSVTGLGSLLVACFQWRKFAGWRTRVRLANGRELSLPHYRFGPFVWGVSDHTDVRRRLSA